MRLAIDVRWMVPGVAGGNENVARSFLHELSQIKDNNLYKIMLNYRCKNILDFTHVPHLELFHLPYQEILKSKLKSKLNKIYKKLYPGHAINIKKNFTSYISKTLDVDMVYSFPGYIQEDLYNFANILVVPDIQHEYYPEFFSAAVLAQRQKSYGASMKKAVHLCAISEFTRKTLIEKLHINPHKITTILPGVDDYFTSVPNNNDLMILNQYNLQPNSYLFFPAHTWHHKNHIAVIESLKILHAKYRLTPKLICTGGACEAQFAIEKYIIKNDLQNQVAFLGYCSRLHMPALYRGAIALIFPSLFEGFGLPVVEAMKSGCPVVCSNTTSLPEIASDAALLIDPHHYEAIADALAHIILYPELRESLRDKGLTQSAKFSWRQFTAETLALCEQVSFHLKHAPKK